MRTDIFADLIDIRDHRGHVLGGVLVATRHCTRERVDDDQDHLLPAFLNRSPDELDDSFAVSSSCFEQIESRRHDSQRYVSVMRKTVVAVDRFHPVDKALSTLGREIENETRLFNLMTAPASA
jgi:hypothetical protein